ncbi:5-formyltetrahydrofolate cyclo-ligase [Spirosoma oryzicola]|uniref:5-formyltetrahydrofolate cyclo-ligase n=1 Tax=Spirosoma oryzicola TaxID=2898794 RepID=UPI001E4906E8|nr:5-formyltetrahydrofolate cyclo-ligase [Spirosoma oryzicola]UHG91502.1 5-formyltetrahydrofolate cyclo-ligase [Spirosoma oryzicola]
MKKADLRRQYLTTRKALSDTALAEYSHKICAHFFDQVWTDGRLTVHTFLPIARQNELNTWLIVHRFWHDFPQVRLAVSITDADTYQLTHYELTPDTLLATNQWGIPEPIAEDSLAVKTSAIDLVLVPLLAFDRQGHRVGYGGGFYDRFLADCRPDCLKVGLSFVEPVEQIDAIEPTDIPLEVCVTPDSVVYFK